MKKKLFLTLISVILLWIFLSILFFGHSAPKETTFPSVPTAPPTETMVPTESPAQTPALTVPPTIAPTLTPSPTPVAVATDAPAHVPDFTPAPTTVPVATAPPDVDWYQHMLNTSILSTGTNNRLEKVIAKIAAGEKVTVMAYGGSITEGAGAENFSYSYGEQFIYALQEAYPGSSIHYHNSGLGGTPSTMGLMRYQRDVIDVIGDNPDLLILEFAVNDYEEPTKGRAYESLVRTVLERDEDTAVILLFSVFKNKWNAQEAYIPIGEHYGLPMVSLKDAIATAYTGGQMTDTDYFADIYHPTNYGHEITANCLTELFTRVAAKDATLPTAPVPETSVYGADFQDIHFVTARDNDGTLVTPGSFFSQDNALQTFARTTLAAFPDNWHHTAEGGAESLKIELTCKNILLTFKLSSSQNFGKASVYIDGNHIMDLNGHLNGAWNNTDTVLLLDDTISAPHILEIRMAEGQENKLFTVLGIGYS